jgi:hypothetical protein
MRSTRVSGLQRRDSDTISATHSMSRNPSTWYLVRNAATIATPALLVFVERLDGHAIAVTGGEVCPIRVAGDV